VFIACSTLCFARESLEQALRQIAELEFDKFELALFEDGRHLRPSEVGDGMESALQRVRRGPSLVPSAIQADFGPVDWSEPAVRRRFEALCRFAKALSVAVLTLPAADRESPLDEEIHRLTSLLAIAMREGLVLSLPTYSHTLAGDPKTAVRLCRAIPGLGLTLDPSHFVGDSARDSDLDALFPYVQNVHLRDTGKNPDEFQVRVGQGQIEFTRLVAQLQRHGYDRGLTVAILDRVENPFDREVEVRKLKLLLETLI